ncbi:hypothetical protein IAU60_000488 [Kwoniella sp. DSM 27419]
MATNSAASPKAAHYTASLTAALLRGGWAESIPGQAPNKTELSWGELVRKWGKHTHGNTALIHHLRDISLLYLSSTSHSPTSSSGFITVPAPSATGQTGDTNYGLGSSNSSAESAGTGSQSHGSFVHIPHPHLRHKKKASIDVAPSGSTSGSTIRPTESASTATGGSGGSKASYLSSGDLDGDDSEDHRSWGEGNAWWNGVGSEAVDEVREGIKAIEGLISEGKLGPADRQSASMVLAYHYHALGSHEDALRIYNTVDWNADGRSGVVPGDAAVMERIRGRCLQGLSYELSQPPDYPHAIASYLAVVPLLSSLASFTLPRPTYLNAQTSQKPVFEPYREVFRYLSTALSRATIICARASSGEHMNQALALRMVRTYHAFSSSWPPTFRPVQRQRMLLLYLRTLGVSSERNTAEAPLLYDVGATGSATAPWYKEVVEAIRQGRTLLSATTSFPRAGSMNKPVIAFTGLAVSLYSKSTSLGREVISVLWWAMTLTFQSQTILRHLTHLLSDVGDSTDARRVFELYVQLVLKSRQTQQPESSLQLRDRHIDEDAPQSQKTGQDAMISEPTDAERSEALVPESDVDGDDRFVETLLAGTRLLCRDLAEPEEAWRYACLAGDVIAQRPVSPKLRARVEEAKGIVRMTIGAHGADAIHRPTYQSQAIDHLVASVDLDPTASGYYHLAHCQAEARAVDAATGSIRSSLELNPDSVQAWHLLALLLTARRDWVGATKACEAGISVWEQDEETAEQDLPTDEQVTTADGVGSRDFAVVPPSPSTRSIQSPVDQDVLLRDGSFPYIHIASPETTPLSRSARLEHVIRLRMTLNVIIEKTQGPEMAMLKQQELFAFFSARSGKNRGTMGYTTGFGKAGGMRSIASRGSLSALATGADGREGLGGSFVSVEKNDAPISVIPPTPAGEHHAAPFTLAEPISDKAPVEIQTSSPTPGRVSPVPGELQGERPEEAEKRPQGPSDRPGHLDVPTALSPGTSPINRPPSVRRLTAGSMQNNVGPRERVASGAQSFAPTAIHSHFRNAPTRHATVPPPPPLQPTDDHGRTPAESRILSNLWLMSAATFRRWGKPEQSLVAIEEAEVLDPENADVWVQLGMYHAALAGAASGPGSNPISGGVGVSDARSSGGLDGLDRAEASFVKSLLLRPDHPPAVVGLSKIYLENGQADLAESLLNQLTQEAGWDIAEAWFWLGKVAEAQDRRVRARECWTFALGLEEGRAVRSWHEVGRWL